MKNEQTHSENKKHEHVTSFFNHGVVLVVLLTLTFLSVFVANINFGAFSVAVALLVASIKATTVLIYFMHLKFENLFMRLMVIGVFVLFALVIIITFIDYLLR